MLKLRRLSRIIKKMYSMCARIQVNVENEELSIASEVTWTHPFIYELVNAIPINVKSLIDVGCGRGIIGALTRIYRNPKRVVGIDAFELYLNFCKKHNFYDELYALDLNLNLPFSFRDNEFDVATCIETIEHLPKKNGQKLLDELERIATNVIVSTPNVIIKQYLDENPFQIHRSKWTVRDFKKRGYIVRGVGQFVLFGSYIPYLSFLLSKFTYKIPTFSSFLLAGKLKNELKKP